MFRPSPCIFTPLAALIASVGALSGCGGTVDASRGDGIDEDGSGGEPSADGGRSASGGRVGAGGARAVGGAMGAGGAVSLGGAIAAGGAVVQSDGGLPVCPIRESGTYLTADQCHACIPPGSHCTSPGPLPAIQVDAEGCVRVIEMQTTLYCVWYETREQFNQGWGAVSLCDSNPGVVACGGGI
jgi:hypothetical protein